MLMFRGTRTVTRTTVALVPARDAWAAKIAAFNERWPFERRPVSAISDAELVVAVAQAQQEYEEWLAYIVRDIWRDARVRRHPFSGLGVPASFVACVLAVGASWWTWNARYFDALGIENLSVVHPWDLYEFVREGMPNTHGAGWEWQPKTVAALVRARKTGLVRKHEGWKLTDAGETLLHETAA